MKQAKEENHLIVVFTVEGLTGSVTAAVGVLFLSLDLRLGSLLPLTLSLCASRLSVQYLSNRGHRQAPISHVLHVALTPAQISYLHIKKEIMCKKAKEMEGGHHAVSGRTWMYCSCCIR